MKWYSLMVILLSVSYSLFSISACSAIANKRVTLHFEFCEDGTFSANSNVEVKLKKHSVEAQKDLLQKML